MGNVQNFVWLRWTLLTEYPGKFFTIPAVILAEGVLLFCFGLMGGNPLTVVALVYLGYLAGLVALVCFVGMLLFRRPDQERS